GEAREEEAARRGPALLDAIAAVLIVLELGGLAVDEVEQRPQPALVAGDAAAAEGALGRERRRLAGEQPRREPLVEGVDGEHAGRRLPRGAAEEEQALERARLEEH